LIDIVKVSKISPIDSHTSLVQDPIVGYAKKTNVKNLLFFALNRYFRVFFNKKDGLGNLGAKVYIRFFFKYNDETIKYLYHFASHV